MDMRLAGMLPYAVYFKKYAGVWLVRMENREYQDFGRMPHYGKRHHSDDTWVELSRKPTSATISFLCCKGSAKLSDGETTKLWLYDDSFGKESGELFTSKNGLYAKRLARLMNLRANTSRYQGAK